MGSAFVKKNSSIAKLLSEIIVNKFPGLHNVYATIPGYLQQVFIAADDYICLTTQSTGQKFVIFRIIADRFG